MNDCDWWIAPSLEEAVADVYKYYNCDDKYMVEEPRKLTAKELDSLKFVVDAEPPKVISFREELNNRIKMGAKTEIFASTEY